jgi:methyltransferase (TIGR00027 family)
MTPHPHGFDAVARTALLTAALRARESTRTDRLYEDPYAGRLAGEYGSALFDEVVGMTLSNRNAIASDGRRPPNTLDYNAIRVRFIDDWLARTLSEGGFDQVVIAAAGMDTRAYRLTWPHPVEVYEIDRPGPLDFKEAALAGYEPGADVRRHLVRSDLVTDDWCAELAKAGFDTARPAVWVLEGVLYYLTEKAALGLFARLGEFCAPGSPLICDMVNAAALRAPSSRTLLALFEQWGSPWLFGSDEPERLLGSYGFDVTAVQPGEPGADYGRWGDSVVDRNAPEIPRVFYVHGRRA